MAKQVKLAAQARSGLKRSNVSKLRRQGLVPAIIYGGKSEPQALQVPEKDLQTLLSHAVSEHILVDLEVEAEGATASRTAIIQEVQHNPIGGDILHVDFLAVSMTEKIEAEIPVEPIGEATGVKNFGGLLEQTLHALEIECLPGDLPELISVDVSGLNIGDQIMVSDIKLPPGVSALADAEQVVFAVTAPKVEEEPVPAAPAAPEVIREKKEESPGK